MHGSTRPFNTREKRWSTYHTAVKDCVSVYISQKPNKKLEKMLTFEIISTVTASSHFVIGGLDGTWRILAARPVNHRAREHYSLVWYPYSNKKKKVKTT